MPIRVHVKADACTREDRCVYRLSDEKSVKEKFETFKAGILKWKNKHREEYNEFARVMTDCDENFYFL